MISISKNLIPLNDEFEINDAFYQQNIGSWFINFKKYLNVFNYIYQFFKYLSVAATVVYYFVFFTLIGCIFFYGQRLIIFLTKFFINDIWSYFNNKKLYKNEHENIASSPQKFFQPSSSPKGNFIKKYFCQLIFNFSK